MRITQNYYTVYVFRLWNFWEIYSGVDIWYRRAENRITDVNLNVVADVIRKHPHKNFDDD